MSRHALPEERWPSAAEAEQSRLFSPLELPSGLRLAARTWVPAMVPWRATESGQVTPQVIDWYRRFARGQPAVLVVEATGIRDVPSGPLLRIGHDRFVPGLAEIVSAVAEASAGQTRLFIQILDFLAVRRRPEPKRFLGEFLRITETHRLRLSELNPALAGADESGLRAALLRCSPEELQRVLSAREWEALQRGERERVTDLDRPHIAGLPAVLPALFADAAERARQAGFDGVEIHAAHAYTLASFLSRLNDRTDGYGGSREARVRLPLDVVAAVRARVGARYCVGLRMLGEEGLNGGSDVSDAQFYALAFARAGLDFLSISRGGKFEDARQPRVGEAVYPYTGPSGHLCMPSVFDSEPPFGRNLGLAAAIRASLRAAGLTTPIVASGGINSFTLAEAALRTGQADLIGAARQSLADPDWFRKLREGRGEAIVRCLYTNYCEALDQQHKQVTCQLWDRLLDGESDVPLSADGHRRLVAPTGDWSPRQRPRAP